MQQNRKNAKGDEYFCKALYSPDMSPVEHNGMLLINVYDSVF